MRQIKEQKEEGAHFIGIWRFTIRDEKTGKVKRVYEYKNLIPTVGRTAIANHLSDATPDIPNLRVNYSALGTNTTAPANGDTQLGTETFRKAIASETNSNNVAYFTAFYTAAEVSGTFREAALFINATATANSGTLFSRVAINITKSLTETLTIDYTVTIV